MADEVDKAQEPSNKFLEIAIENARGDIKPGKPGECDLCGEWFGRLVGGACVPCREKYHLE